MPLCSLIHLFISSFFHAPLPPCQSACAAASYKVVNCSVAHKGWWWIDCSTEHGDRESKEKDDRWWALIRDLGGESAHCNLETCMKNLPPSISPLLSHCLPNINSLPASPASSTKRAFSLHYKTCFACFISVSPISHEADGVLTAPVIGDDKLGVPNPMRFATALM